MHRVLVVVVLHVVQAVEGGEDGDLVAAGAGRVVDAAGADGEDVGFAILKGKRKKDSG